MAFEFVIPNATAVPITFPAHRVYFAEKWTDEWVERTHLYADFVHWGCGSEIGRAQLHWKYGRIIQPGETAVTTATTLEEIIGWYVKVEIDQWEEEPDPDDPDGPLVFVNNMKTWEGVVTEIADEQYGVDHSDGTTYVRRGVQHIVCHDYTLLADRIPIDISVTLSDEGGETTVRRAIQFNSHHNYLDHTKTVDERKTLLFGNMSSGQTMAVVQAFATNLKTAEKWSSRTITDYLLAYFWLKDATGLQIAQIGLTMQSIACIPRDDAPVVACEGKTLKQIFDHLFDRRRMMTWRLVTDTDDNLLLDVRSLADETITLPSGGIIWANDSRKDLNFESHLDVQHAVVKTSEAHRVGRVVCRGARKRSCFSISQPDGTLDADWLATDQTAYNEGPGTLGSLDYFQQKSRLSNWRKEDRFHRVYSYFRLPPDWDGMVGDGTGGAEMEPFFPPDIYYGDEQVYWPELRFDKHLPLGLLLAAKDQSPEDALKAAAWIKIYNDGQDRYQHVENMALDRMVQRIAERPVIDFSCSLRVQEFAPGLIVRTGGGRTHGQEAIAKTDFVKLAGVDQHDPPLDWLTMIATVMLDLDSHVEGIWPDPMEDPGSGSVLRTLVIDLGDKYRLDYVAPGTVIGVEDGILQRDDYGGYFRDDRTILTDFARVLYAWYARERRAMSVTLSRIGSPVDVGDMITTLSGGGVYQNINSVVTSVSMDLKNGTTSFTTDFGELDPNQF